MSDLLQSSPVATFAELRELAKPIGVLLVRFPKTPSQEYQLRDGLTGPVLFVSGDLDEMAEYITDALAGEAATEVEAQDPSEKVPGESPSTSESITDPEPVTSAVEPADAVEAVGDTWAIAQQDSDGNTTYWSQDGGYSLLMRQGVALWPNKQEAINAVREALGGKIPRSNKAVKLSDEQAELVDSPYRVIQGEVADDDQLPLPTEFSEMEQPELVNAANRWLRVANSRAAEADSKMATALEAVVHTGSALLACKALCKERGEKWVPWVEASDWHGTPRLAQYYMAVAKKRNGVSHLDSNQSLRGAIKQITGKKPNDEPGKKHNPSHAAAKKAGAKATRKAKAINEAATLIAELNRVVSKDLTQHTLTAADAEIITEKMITPLWDIRLNLQALANTASTDDLNGIGE